MHEPDGNGSAGKRQDHIQPGSGIHRRKEGDNTRGRHNDVELCLLQLHQPRSSDAAINACLPQGQGDVLQMLLTQSHPEPCRDGSDSISARKPVRMVRTQCHTLHPDPLQRLRQQRVGEVHQAQSGSGNRHHAVAYFLERERRYRRLPADTDQPQCHGATLLQT